MTTLRRLAATSLAALLLAGIAPVAVFAASPNASAATVTTNEDQAKAVTLSANDPDLGTITGFDIVTGPSTGTLGTVSAPDCTPGPACTATVTYTPDANTNGTDQFTFTATDSDNEVSSTATAHINVTAVNDAPNFTNGGDVTVNEDSGAYSQGWATGLSKGPADESGDVLSFDVVADDTTLFATQPALSASGNLTFTPKANAFGQTDVNVTLTDDGGTANGGDDTSAVKVFTLTVNAVNDQPSFTKGSNQSDLEDAGSQSVGNWASAISKGPSNESSQTVSFLISSNNNPTLFSAGPAVSATGTLSYTPAPDANGTATIGVEAKDSGGVANGGDDTSPEQTFTISVTPVNDTPSFTKGADQGADEDAGAQSVTGWATDLSAGPADEAGQALSFELMSDSNAALFAVPPAVDSDGTLTYTPAANANGTATIGFRIVDDGGVANGGDNASNTQTFHISVPAVNDPPTFTKGADVTVDEDSGAKTVAGWATGISKGPANESSQTLTFTATPDDPSLFAAGPDISASGTLTFTPAANAEGSTNVDVVLMDDGGGTDTSSTQSFTITIDAVNDAPSFTKGSDQTVSEDSGAHSLAWATSISAGPASESSQDVSFTVDSNSDASLFAAGPTVADDGTLSYTPAPDANGTAIIGVTAHDDGGTGNGGDDTSATQSFSITITPVNDEPSFTVGPDASTPEQTTAAMQTVIGWATNISAGPADESGQALTFEVTGNDNAGLFATQPAVSAAGVLSFTPAIHIQGVAHVTLRLHDDGGTDDGGVDTSATQSFTIDVSGVNDAPIAGNDVATARLAGPTTINVLGNDSGGPGESADPIKITSVVEGSRGYVTVAADGLSLTYDPIGCSTGTDVFSYTIKDTGGTGLADTATVFVTIAAPTAYPVADGPRPGFVTGSTIGSSTPVRLTWCGATSGTTSKAYRLDQSRNGGAFTTVVSSTTATSSTRNLAVSTSYQFRTRYTDKKNRSAFGTGPKFRVIRTQDNTASIVYSSGWVKSSKGSPSGGTSHATTGKGKTATMTFTGRAFAIVGTIGKSRGSFNVYVDGVKVTSKAISTRATKTHEKRVLYARATANGTHTIRILTSGNGRVDLDAILTLIAG